MTIRKLALAALTAISVLPLQAMAQSTCSPQTLAAAVDRYSGVYNRSGFGVEAWRKINGLGDPMIDPKGADAYYGNDETKKKFQAVATTVDPAFKLPGLDSYGSNCLYDYPLTVLETRIKDLGKDHPYAKHWLAGQGAVFEACVDAKAVSALPAPFADEKLKSLAADDRAYQEATLALYRAYTGYQQVEGDAGLASFRTIAASQSVHAVPARYMAAYVIAKKKQFKDARAETQAILADATLASIHHITRQLQGYVVHEEDSAEGWALLLADIMATLDKPAADILASEDAKEDYARALYDIDFMGIRARSDDDWLTGKLPENPTLSKAITDGARKYPMIAWMIAGQTLERASHETSWQLAGPKWDARARNFIGAAQKLTGGYVPLAKDALEAYGTDPSDPARAALWTKANESMKRVTEACGDSNAAAAAMTFFSQAVRSSARAGRFDEVIAGLDAAKAFNESESYSFLLKDTVMLMLGKGLLADARAFRDKFLGTSEPWTKSYAHWTIPRIKLALAEDQAKLMEALAGAGRDDRLGFAALNFLPASALYALAADDKTLDLEERAFFARVAYTRAYALGGVPTDRAGELLFALNPELGALRDKVKADYPAISPARVRLLTILRSPRFNILVNGPDTLSGLGEAVDAISNDHNDRNWWCPFEPDRQLGFLRDQFDQWSGNALPWRATERMDLAALIDPADKATLDDAREAVLRQHPLVAQIDWKELAALAAAPSAPKRLTGRALEWAQKAKAGDPAAAEALALAVRAARYGCNWHGSHKSYSKPAQELLKAKFADTTWAAQTPYWYDCQLNERDIPEGTKPGECPVKTWTKQPPLK